jgi:hypothetical protein
MEYNRPLPVLLTEHLGKEHLSEVKWSETSPGTFEAVRGAFSKAFGVEKLKENGRNRHSKDLSYIPPDGRHRGRLIFGRATDDDTEIKLVSDIGFFLRFLTQEARDVTPVQLNELLSQFPTHSRDFIINNLWPLPIERVRMYDEFDVRGSYFSKNQRFTIYYPDNMLAPEAPPGINFVIPRVTTAEDPQRLLNRAQLMESIVDAYVYESQQQFE